MTPRQHELTVEARPDDLPGVRTFVEEALQQSPLSEKARREARLAVDEACANIIEHAYAGRRGSITVEVAISGGSATITLRDHGRPFDPEAVGSPDLSRYVKTGKKGGFGLFLIHKIMDEVRYARAGDVNTLTLVKRFAPVQTGLMDRLKSRLHARSLRVRFSAQASLLLTLLILVGSSVMLVRVGNMTRREILTRGAALASGLRPHAADLLLNPQAFGPKQTQLIAAAKSAAARGPITRLVIVDSTGTVWAASDEDLILTALSPPRSPIQLPPDTQGVELAVAGRAAPGADYVLALPVMSPGPRSAARSRLGTIYVTVPAAQVEKRVLSARRAVVVIAGVLLVAGLAAVTFLVGLVVKPIQRLTEGVRAIGAGQERELDDAGLEELDAIAHVVTEAMSQVRDAQKSQADQDRLQEEVEIAKSIQQSLLPSTLPEMAGFEIGTLYQAAKKVGGDYYDFVRVGDETWGLAVADVSGKGVPASMVMMMIRTALRLEARGQHSAAEVLERVNRFVTADMHKGMFVTMFYVVLDSRERQLSYASAGHNPLILYRAATKETYFLKPSGFPVGIDLPDESLFGRSMSVEKVALEQGDLLVAYTDGITEAMNSQMEQFGNARFLDAIKRHAHCDPEEFCLQIQREMADFTGDTPQNDDMTLVAIKERLSATEMKVEARERLLDLVEVEGVPVAEACQRVGVSPTTYYRYRRLRLTAGREGLRDRRKRIQPARLSNEQEDVLIQLVREDPDRGARRLALAMSEALKQEIHRGRVLESLRRRKLNSRETRRAFAGWPAPAPRPPRRRKRRSPTAAAVAPEMTVAEVAPQLTAAEVAPAEVAAAEVVPLEVVPLEVVPAENGSPEADAWPGEPASGRSDGTDEDDSEELDLTGS
jgi:serine phosphatase RsbU (regulator of sigma subunit)/anti-sigma regulatory factor (Ser/Thr protein kinase)/transposase